MKLLLLLLFTLPAYATITDQVALQPEGTWLQVQGTNTLKSLDPEKNPATNLNYPGSASYRNATGFKAVPEAYSGGVKAWNRGTCGTILYFSGGHADYKGSGVYEFDPCGPVTWKALSDPYDIKGVLGASPTGFYPDGSPQPPHTGQTLIWTGKELIVLLGQVDPINPSWKPIMALFDPEKPKVQQWRRVEGVNSGAEWGISLWDSKRKLACWQGFSGSNSYPGIKTTYQCFDPVTNAWTEYQKWADGQLNNYGAIGGYNPDLDLVTQLNAYRYSTTRQFQIGDRDNGNPAINWKRGVMINAPPIDPEVYGFGTMAWSDHRKAWIVFMDRAKTGTVYEVKTTLIGGLPTHTWTKLNTDSSKPSCGNQPTCGAGSWDKFQVFRLGDHEHLCGILTLEGGTACFKLPGTIPAPPTGPVCMPPEFQGLPVCSGPITGFRCPPLSLWCEDFTTGHTGAFYAGSLGVPRLEDGRMVIDVPAKSSGNNHGGISFTFPRVPNGALLAFTYQREVDAATADLPGMKEFILKYTGESCQGGSFIQSHYPERPRWLRPNINCGNISFDRWVNNFKTLQLNGSGPPADFNCTYQDKVKNDPNVTNCVTTKPGVKQTYYIEVQMGHYGQPDSSIRMWQKNGSEPCKLYTNVDNYQFEAGLGWEEILFIAYITGRTEADVYPEGKVYFDNLAGSLQPFKAQICG